MAKARSPNREKAYEIWKEAKGEISNREIAAKLNISEKSISGWKAKDKWAAKMNGVLQSNERSTPLNQLEYSEKKRKKGGQIENKNAVGSHGFGNQNAIGNNGGAPIGNKNALITGKYERIFKGCLDEEEQEACQELDTDELAQINLELELLTVRERRMMKRIINYEKKKEDIEERITQIVQVSTKKNSIYDEAAGRMKDSIVTTLVPKEMVQMKKSILDKLLRIESHLTDIQAKKTRAIEIKHKIMLIRNPTGGGDNVPSGADPLETYSKEELMAMIDDD